MYLNKIFNKHLVIAAAALVAVSCGKDPNNTGTEYAPQMYHSIPYEPYSQVTDTTSEHFNSNPYNKYGAQTAYGMNMRLPVKGTVKRKQYAGQVRGALANDIMQYNIPADSIEYAARVLKNPVAANADNLENGKVLYTRYCSPCHGAGGQGDGKVAALYKGVPNYTTGRYKELSEGHIFHTITHGKGRMWPHGSQLNPDERWKVVLYVQKLQRGEQ